MPDSPNVDRMPDPIKESLEVDYDERLNQYFDSNVRDWIIKDYAEELSRLVKKTEDQKRHPNWRRSIGDLQEKFTMAIFSFTQGSDFNNPAHQETILKWEEKLQEDLFGNGESVANSAGSENREEMERTIIGAITEIAMYTAVVSARPDLREKISLTSVAQGGSTDWDYKIDFEFTFKGFVNEYLAGSPQRVAALQVKPHAGDKILIEIVEPDNLKSKYIGGVQRIDAEKMLEYSEKVEEEENHSVTVQPFVVGLPRRHITVLGRWKEQSQGVLKDFAEQAERLYILPPSERTS